MHTQVNLMAPAIFALVTLASFWFSMNAIEAKPNSGVLVIPADEASYYSIS